MDEMDEQIYKRYLAKRSENDLRILLERYKEGLILFPMRASRQVQVCLPAEAPSRPGCFPLAKNWPSCT